MVKPTVSSCGLVLAIPVLAIVVNSLPEEIDNISTALNNTIANTENAELAESRSLEPIALPLASPERSSIDEEHFNMAASYLKSQFSIPHHVVPTYEETANWWPGPLHVAQDRIRRLPNLQNHQLDSLGDSSFADYEYIDTSNEFQREEDKRFKRKPDLDYTLSSESNEIHSGNLKQNKLPPSNSISKPVRNTRRPKLHKSPRVPRHPSQFKSFGPKRVLPLPHVPQNLNFLAAVTSQLRNSLSSAFTGSRRRSVYPLGVRAGYLRNQLKTPRRNYNYNDIPTQNWRNKESLMQKNVISDDRRKWNNPLPDKRMSHFRERPTRGNINVHPGHLKLDLPTIPNIKRSLGGKLGVNKRKRKRRKKDKSFMKKKIEEENTGSPTSLRRNDSTDEGGNEDDKTHTGNYFDGLEMDFWEDSIESSTKPDYRRRWKDIDNVYEEKKQSDQVTERKKVGSRRIDNDEIVYNIDKKGDKQNIGWGEKMWKEIENDWYESEGKWETSAGENIDDNDIKQESYLGENSLSVDDGARYLSAWADAGKFLEPKFFDNQRDLKSGTSTKLEFLPAVPDKEVLNSESNFISDGIDASENTHGAKKKSVKLPFPKKTVKRRRTRMRSKKLMRQKR